MSPFDRPAAQNIITSTVLWSFAIATFGFIVALIATATAVSSQPAVTVHGPLSLFMIQKSTTATGGMQASIGVLPGFIWYVAATGATTAVISGIRLLARKPHLTTDAK